VVNAKKLKFVFQIARHGHRSPLNPDYSKFYTVGPQELTPSGMRQQYLLGTHLRKKYVENDDPEMEGFLSSSYNSSEWYVGSTHLRRTVESARYFMLGFYPPRSMTNKKDIETLPFKYSTVPVYNNKAQHDTIHTTGNCLYLGLQYGIIHQTPQLWKKYDDYFKPRIYQKLKQVLNVTDDKELNYFDAFKLGDAVESLVFQGVIDQNEFTDKEWTYIKRLQIPWIMSSFTPLGTKLFISKILNPIVELIDFKIFGYWKSKTKLPPFTGEEKFVHYSGHDTTMANILLFLHPEDFVIDTLPYASAIEFELYELEAHEVKHPEVELNLSHEYDNYQVKVLYNNEALKLTHCEHTYCSLSEFMSHFKEHGLSPHEVKTLCKEEFELAQF
jgi:hypothetical protein